MANRLERNTKDRERVRLQARLDQLFAAQEKQTAGKKGASNKFSKGGTTGKNRPRWDNFVRNLYPNQQGTQNQAGLGNRGRRQYSSAQDFILGMYPQQYNNQNQTYGGFGGVGGPNRLNEYDQLPRANYQQQQFNPATQNSQSPLGGLKSSPSGGTAQGGINYGDPLTQVQPLGATQLQGNFGGGQGLQQTGPLAGLDYQGYQDRATKADVFKNKGGGFGKFANIAGNILPFAGGIYDLIRGSQEPEQLNAEDYYNPQYGRSLGLYNKALGLMANRKYNARPELQDADRSSAIFEQGIRNTGSIGAGAVRNYQASSRVRRDEQRGRVFTKAQNANRQYEGEEAQLAANVAGGVANLGAQRAQRKFSIRDYNERSKANRRNIFGSGLSTIGRGIQNQQLMANMQNRDVQRMGILPSYGGGMFNFNQQGIQFGAEDMSDEEILQYVRGGGRV